MALLPIIERELRVALRKGQPARRRVKVAMIAAGGALLYTFLAQIGGSNRAGAHLHLIFCLAGFYTVIRAPQLTAGLFSKERREQTLGLLFLSGLSAGEVFLSKLVSAVAIAFTDLLAIFPMLALPFLMGGVSFEVFLATITCLPNLLLFALTVSLLASVLTEDDGAAVLLSLLLAAAVCAVPPALSLAQVTFGGGAAPRKWWLLLSPAYGPWLMLVRFGGGKNVDFWRNAVVTLAWSSVFLGLAAFRLTRLWRDRPETGGEDLWKQRWRRWTHGTVNWRRGLAHRWLEVNPIAWLAARDRKPQSTACFMVGVMLGIWMIGLLVWRTRWASIPNFFIIATLLNLALRWLIYYTAAAGLGNRRVDGSYELVLTTPVNPGEIVWGQLESLREHFGRVCRGVFLFEMALMIGGLMIRDWDGPALFVYFTIWGGLLVWAWRQARYPGGALLAMWAGLNSGRAAHAAWRAFGLNSWVWIWVIFNLRRGFSRFPMFPTGSLVEVIFAAIGLYLLAAYLVRPPQTLNMIERRLVREFREIVREPLPDPADPRFKLWKVYERFPWGWSLIQQQLHERVARGRVKGTRPI
jgi:hypothetical protein